MKLRGYRHKSSLCPGCRQLINATTDPKQRGAPRAGVDLTICVGCGTLLKFGPGLELLAVTPEDLERLPKSTVEELREQQERWKERRGKSDSRVVVP